MTDTLPQRIEAAEGADREQAQFVIDQIARVARVIASQAGVGAMETAGSIVSFLAANPSYTEGFVAGGTCLDWPIRWHAAGCLSWHGQDGKIHWPGEGENKQ